MGARGRFQEGVDLLFGIDGKYTFLLFYFAHSSAEGKEKDDSLPESLMKKGKEGKRERKEVK